jgi:hypothetical protein
MGRLDLQLLGIGFNGHIACNEPMSESEIGVEACGKSRVLIGGLAEELHKRNLRALYYQMYGELPKSILNEDDIESYDEEEEGE